MEYIAIFIGLTIIVTWLVLNIRATFIVYNTYFVVKERRMYQMAFIWVLPFVGSILAIYLNKHSFSQQNNKNELGNHPNITDQQAMIYDQADFNDN